VELDALGKRTLGVFDAILQARHRYGRDANRLLRGQQHAKRRRRAGTAVARALGRGLRPHHGRGGRGHRAAVRGLRRARALRRDHAHVAGRSALPSASRRARAARSAP
jgi:hypothetical protein